MKTWCVMLAAGRGERSKLKENKVFFKYKGRSVLSRSLDAFANSGLYDGIVLVLAKSERKRYDELAQLEGANSLVKVITEGGATRGESALNGLRCVPDEIDIVSIHDAARPFVTSRVLENTIRDAQIFGSGVISTPVTDTVRMKNDNGSCVIDRSKLRAVQTPQTFMRDRILQAYEKANTEGISVTDDAAVYERMFGTVHLTDAEDAEKNIKLTLPGDFTTEDKMDIPLIGCGYDAHRLKEGRKLVLCGVEIPHDRGLDGHSDADVAVHALMDAILGALGEGDIGHLFPDTDPQYKGLSSMLLLREVVKRMGAKGYRIGNADITIVAQKPKLAQYIEQMRKNISNELGCDISHANVKATTTEHMGFEGEEIGISSQAVVLLIPKAD